MELRPNPFNLDITCRFAYTSARRKYLADSPSFNLISKQPASKNIFQYLKTFSVQFESKFAAVCNFWVICGMALHSKQEKQKASHACKLTKKPKQIPKILTKTMVGNSFALT